MVTAVKEHQLDLFSCVAKNAERLEYVNKDQEVKIGSSIGIAHYPQQSFDRESLIKASDIAMY